MAIDYGSKSEVIQLANEFRRKHGAMSWDAHIDDLIRLHGLEQGRYGPPRSPFGAIFLKAQQDARKAVQALFSLKERVILLANDLPQSKEPFSKGHELGHSVIPWHQDILYACDEHDLSPAARGQMEWEANTFSSAVLLPRPLLAEYHRDAPTHMSSVIRLKELSETSIAMTAYAYVEEHPQKCALLTLSEVDGEQALELTKKALSPRAVKSSLSSLVPKQRFGRDHVLWILSRTRHKVMEGEVTMTDETKRYHLSLVNTGYAIFALMVDPES